MKIALYFLIIMYGMSQNVDFDTHLEISKEEYKERRKKLIEKLDDAPILLVGNVLRNRINDTNYEFKQESNFYYLTGLNEPNAYLVLSKKPFNVNGKMVNEVLFTKSETLQSLTWEGKRLGPEAAVTALGFESALPTFSYEKIKGHRRPKEINNFDVFMREFAQENRQFYLNTPIIHTQTFGDQTETTYYNQFAKSLKTDLTKNIRPRKDKSGALLSLEKDSILIKSRRATYIAIAQLREIKSEQEIKLLKRSIEITQSGHLESFKIAKDVHYEYQVEAAIEYAFKLNGAEAVGYNSIVGCGENGTILHYDTNREKHNKTQIYCLDAGAEYKGYTSDVTRSFPANGTFTKAQREIYTIVLDAQKAGEKAFVAGNTYQTVDSVINDVIFIGLKRLGLIETKAQMKEVYMHGWGHSIGLDVHDPIGTFPFTFKEGMIFTIEPGIYISDRLTFDVPEEYKHIGIRIEDMYLITEDGNVHLTQGIPREIEEIEKVAKEKSQLLIRHF